METMTGEQNPDAVHTCAKCGTSLWNDHGWVLIDGTVICRKDDKCGQRQIHNQIEAAKAAGTWKPRWR